MLLDRVKYELFEGSNSKVLNKPLYELSAGSNNINNVLNSRPIYELSAGSNSKVLNSHLPELGGFMVVHLQLP